jgi:hypothetical protein
MLEKNIIVLVNNFKCMYLVVGKVIERCHMPPLRDMGAPRPILDILSSLENNIKNKGSIIGMTPNMGPMSMELISYEVSFEQLLFIYILSISSQHKIWATDIQDKAHG